MSENLENFAIEDKDLPSMPIVAVKVMEQLADPEVTSQDLNRTIAADPAITAKILKICNSSFFGLSREVTSLTEAITFMGFNAIKSLVIVSSTKSVFKQTGLTEKALWEHSICCAIASNMLAKDKRLGNYEEYFIGGLLHDVGKVVFNKKFGEDYKEVMKRVYNDPTASSVDVELHLLNGLTHPGVGGLVVTKWTLPRLLKEAVEHHHEVEEGYEIELENETYCNVISFGNLVCRKLGVGRGAPNENLDLADSYPADFLELEEDYINDFLEKVLEAFESEKSFFE